MYVNLNNPANFQLQEFEQLGFRYIVTGRPTISGETYRTIFVLADAVVTATCPNGDSLSSETLVAGTIIHGFFESVSVASGSLLAYKAGPITAQEIYDFYKAYVYANGGIIEGESCAVTEIAALLAEGLYSMASLVLIPSGYKVGTVYSERPTDSNGQLTFTRNSEATRVNSEGLVEKVRTNILTYSNTFSNGAWTKLLVTVTGGQEGYDGTNNAWLLQITNPIGRLEGFPFLNNLVTLSIYAKAGTTNVLTLAQVNAYSYVTCDLSNGTFTGQGGSVVYRNIESVGNGWYRIQLASVPVISLTGISIAPVGIVGDNVYIQNVQLEYGNIATDYIPTTTASVSVGPVANLPRLDYSGGATCPSLLLEPQRTNLVKYSEQIDNAYWPTTAATITANASVSPDGYTNADKFAGDNTSGQHILRHAYFATTALATVIYSFYVKADGITKMGYREAAQTGRNGAFNIATKTTIFTTTGDIISFQDSANGYVRVSIQTQVGSSGTLGLQLFLLDAAYTTGNPNNYSSNVSTSEGVFFYGAQVELGAYATSYINTLGAAVTRLADAASKTGISSLIGQTEGVIFLDFIASAQNQDGAAYSCITIFGTNVDNMQLYTLGTALRWYALKSGAGVLFDQTANQTLVAGQRYKIAYAYKSGDWALYINGVQKRTNTSSTIPATSRFNFNTDIFGPGNAKVENKFNQTLIFKTRLSNAQLAELTTL